MLDSPPSATAQWPMLNVVLAAAGLLWFALLLPPLARRLRADMPPLDAHRTGALLALAIAFSQVSLVFDVPREDGTAVLQQGLSASNYLQVALTAVTALALVLQVARDPRLLRLPFALPYLPVTLSLGFDGLSSLWSIVPSYTLYRTAEAAIYSLATIAALDRSDAARGLAPRLALVVGAWLVAASPELVANLAHGIVFSAAKNNLMPLVCATLGLLAVFEPQTRHRVAYGLLAAVGFVLAGSAASTGALLLALGPAMLVSSRHRLVRAAGAGTALLAFALMLFAVIGLAQVPGVLDLVATILQKPPSELANATGRDDFWPLFLQATQNRMFGAGFAAADRFIQLLVPTGDFAASIGQGDVNYASAHNMYLSTWAGTGVVGLSFCLLVLGTAFGWGLKGDRAGRRVCTTLLLMLALNGLTTAGIFQAWTANNLAFLAILAYARTKAVTATSAIAAPGRSRARSGWEALPAQ